tara:strand:- start:447 stop:701 length:255 start_codon:yes stop_codon:yes gene_type:complete
MSYYSLHKDYFKEYYKNYYLNHREKQIEKATDWINASEEHRIRHAKACKKHLNANKTKIYFNRRLKSLHKTLMKELIDRFVFGR